MKNDFNEDIDNKIRQYLKNESKNISASDNMFFKVRNEILSKNERGFFNMKIGFLKVKTALIAAALFVATTASVGAATGNLTWFGSSSHYNDIKTYPTEDTVKSTVGFSPKYVESFDNGFKFKIFNYSDKQLQNDTKGIVAKFKTADFKYAKDGASENQYLHMSVEKMDEKYYMLDREESKDEATDEATEYNGVKIYYSSYKHKAVPIGYKLTEEEQVQVDDGTLQVCYGEPDMEISETDMQNVSWYDNGISYNILNCNNTEVTKDEMLNMAKKVIDK